MTDKQEYLIINITSETVGHRMNGNWKVDILNKYGKDGWELCAVDDIYYYFKR